MKVAIIGTQGVPASYGGFESLVENLIGENCPAHVHYTVFCSSSDLSSHCTHYKGARLKYIRLHANGMQSIAYDMLSMLRALRGFDVILILGVSGCMFLPFLRKLTKAKIIVNIDGLEHRRDKWGKAARWLLRSSEALAVRYADVVIADNKGIQDYVYETYNTEATLIAYGGDHVKRTVSQQKQTSILRQYGLEGTDYAISVCRIEPENNSHIILEAFSKLNKQLVFIGNWNHSVWAKDLKSKFSHFENIQMLDAIYDLDILYTLRSNASLYIHGHSAGGTNPSLVEAMFFGIPIATWDVVYNRETTYNQAYYFGNVDDLIALVKREVLSGEKMRSIAQNKYTWQKISQEYSSLYNN